MSLDEVHLGLAEPRVGEGLAIDVLLGEAVGRDDAAARAVLVVGSTADQRQDAIAVGLRVAQAA